MGFPSQGRKERSSASPIAARCWNGIRPRSFLSGTLVYRSTRLPSSFTPAVPDQQPNSPEAWSGIRAKGRCSQFTRSRLRACPQKLVPNGLVMSVSGLVW